MYVNPFRDRTSGNPLLSAAVLAKLLRARVDVEANLVLEVPVELRTTGQISCAPKQFSPGGHVTPSA
jgi:hypothetical protein